MRVRERGFTLVELVVVIGLTALAMMFVFSFSVGQLQSGRAQGTADDIASLLSVCQQDAFSGKDGSSYGIRFESQRYHVFVGESFATAESSDTVNLQPGTSVSAISLSSGSSEIVFFSGNLVPQAYGSVTLKSGTEESRIEINREGMIEVHTL